MTHPTVSANAFPSAAIPLAPHVSSLAPSLHRYLNDEELDALRAAGAGIGQGVLIHASVLIESPADLTIGDRAVLEPRVFIGRGQSVSIGRRVIVDHGVTILTATWFAPKDLFPIRDRPRPAGPVTIEDDAWIGPHCLLLPQVTIGRTAVLRPGCVAAANVAPGQTLLGTGASCNRSAG